MGDQKKVGYSIVYESQKSILEHLAGLEFQHVGSWGRRISQFSLVYMVKPYLKIKGLGRWFHGKDHLLLHRTQLQFPAPIQWLITPVTTVLGGLILLMSTSTHMVHMLTYN